MSTLLTRDTADMYIRGGCLGKRIKMEITGLVTAMGEPCHCAREESMIGVLCKIMFPLRLGLLAKGQKGDLL